MGFVESALAGWLTVFSIFLVTVALLSYRRSGNLKLLGVAGAFTIFFVKGVVVTIAVFVPIGLESVFLPMALLDTAALAVFYLSALKA